MFSYIINFIVLLVLVYFISLASTISVTTHASSDVAVPTMGAPPPRVDSPNGVDSGLVAGITVAVVIVTALLAVMIVLLLFLSRRSKFYGMKVESQPLQIGTISE